MEKLYKVPPVAQSCVSRRSRHAAAEMSIERRNTSSIDDAQKRFCAAMPPADEDMCCPAEEFYHIFAESLRGAGVA